jgi:lysozyme
VAGVWTVCDGHTGNDIVKGRKYTDRECDRLMWNDLQPDKKAVDSMIKVPLGEYPCAALFSFTYSVGTSAFSKSIRLKKLNSGDQVGACEELRRCVYAGGIKWKGLMNRRDMERSLCLADGPNDL